MIRVPNGVDPYKFVHQWAYNELLPYGLDDAIVIMSIDGRITREFLELDCLNDPPYYVSNNYWYEGEGNILLLEVFPLSEAVDGRIFRR